MHPLQDLLSNLGQGAELKNDYDGQSINLFPFPSIQIEKPKDQINVLSYFCVSADDAVQKSKGLEGNCSAMLSPPQENDPILNRNYRKASQSAGKSLGKENQNANQCKRGRKPPLGPSLDRPHVCNVCDSSFPNVYRLRRHSESHDPQTMYQCPSCDHRAVRADNVRKHLRQKHPEVNPKINIPMLKAVTDSDSDLPRRSMGLFNNYTIAY